mgnify:CR=1 FL=1
MAVAVIKGGGPAEGGKQRRRHAGVRGERLKERGGGAGGARGEQDYITARASLSRRYKKRSQGSGGGGGRGGGRVVGRRALHLTLVLYLSRVR